MSNEGNQDMRENVAEKVVEQSGLSIKDFAEKTGIPRSTLYNHFKNFGNLDRATQLFWELSGRAQREAPDVFEEAVLGAGSPSKQEDALRLVMKMQRKMEKFLDELEDTAQVLEEPSNKDEQAELEDLKGHMRAMRRLMKLKEIDLREKLAKQGVSGPEPGGGEA